MNSVARRALGGYGTGVAARTAMVGTPGRILQIWNWSDGVGSTYDVAEPFPISRSGTGGRTSTESLRRLQAVQDRAPLLYGTPQRAPNRTQTPSSSGLSAEVVQAEVQRQLGPLLEHLQHLEARNQQLQEQFQSTAAAGDAAGLLRQPEQTATREGDLLRQPAGHSMGRGASTSARAGGSPTATSTTSS